MRDYKLLFYILLRTVFLIHFNKEDNILDVLVTYVRTRCKWRFFTLSSIFIVKDELFSTNKMKATQQITFIKGRLWESMRRTGFDK
jgi:hypothetical protein